MRYFVKYVFLLLAGGWGGGGGGGVFQQGFFVFLQLCVGDFSFLEEERLQQSTGCFSPALKGINAASSFRVLRRWSVGFSVTNAPLH